MDKLVKYDSDEELSNHGTQGETTVAVVPASTATAANLESEWENFEKMLAGGDDGEVVTDTADISSSQVDIKPALATESETVPNSNLASSSVYNPYAYLSYLSTNVADGSATGTSSSAAEEMEKQLEEFLEKTAQAASEEAAKQSQSEDTQKNGGQSDKHTLSHSDSDHSGTESGSESGHSDHSKTPDKDISERKSSETKDSTTPANDEDKAAIIKRLDEMNKPSGAGPSSVRPRRSGSPSRRRSRSHRSRSRSRTRRSRSRSHSRRHRRRRSRSRSGHGSSRRRRRSGSRHRKRSHRSRSPRHRRDGDRHRSSRHKRSRRRSGSRERRRDPNRKAQFAPVPPQALPQRTEDFKARMKRELQQAARDAIAGKGQATPQQALLQTMAAMHAKAQELTGVAVPKFYNPAAINPLKFAEQQQKRKLLWSKAGENKEQSMQKFQGTDVIADEKYRKLMGIKGDVKLSEMSEEQKLKQDELFNKLDQEYAFARITTHTHRGMGLGVVSSMAAQSANEQYNRP